MTIYTTPLQFGYFFSLIMALLFWIRGYKESRLSDVLLGFVMFILAMELQDYTFGFAGINYLWEEMNGFPRSVALLFGPSIYFYFKSQTNVSFSLSKRDLLHLLPWLIYFLIEISFFVQGAEAVNNFQSSKVSFYLSYLNYFARIASYMLYFYLSLRIYYAYRNWTNTEYSNTDIISFRWFRNFLYLMITWILFREIMGIIDGIYDLDFYEDWWWNLALSGTAFYIGLKGYSQKQAQNIKFKEKDNEQEVSLKIDDREIRNLSKKLEDIMKAESLFLQADLSLRELSQHLKVNPNLLSKCINQVFKLNFNDYINCLRIEEFENKVKNKEFKKYTILTLAYDSGFNSKATFNRAFKKIKGVSPKEFIVSFEHS